MKFVNNIKQSYRKFKSGVKTIKDSYETIKEIKQTVDALNEKEKEFKKYYYGDENSNQSNSTIKNRKQKEYDNDNPIIDIENGEIIDVEFEEIDSK